MVRFIRNRMVNHAVGHGFENSLHNKQSPFFALFLDMDPELIDINVHPAKMEAKFVNDQDIYRLLSSAVKERILTSPTEFSRQEGVIGENKVLGDYSNYSLNASSSGSSQAYPSRSSFAQETMALNFSSETTQVKPVREESSMHDQPSSHLQMSNAQMKSS